MFNLNFIKISILIVLYVTTFSFMLNENIEIRADNNIPFNGMYLKYNFTVKYKSFPFKTYKGTRISRFYSTSDANRFKIHRTVIVNGRIISDYWLTIGVKDRIIKECSSRPEIIGLICWELVPVPLKLGDKFTYVDPETKEEKEYAKVTGSDIKIIMEQTCYCWIIEGIFTKSWVEKKTGVKVYEVITKPLEEYKYELIDTNIENFPPESQPSLCCALGFIMIICTLIVLLPSTVRKTK